MISPPGLSEGALVLRAAGFIATSTSGASPAVVISLDPKLIWKADAEQSPLRGTDFGGEIGEGRKIISRKRGRKGELAARQLHPVAGVAGEPHHHRVGKGGLPLVG